MAMFGDVNVEVTLRPAVRGLRCVAILEGWLPFNFEFIVNMMDPNMQNIRTHLGMMRAGVYEVSYLPQSIGPHRLAVMVNNQHVEGSPFYIYVQSRAYPVLTLGRKGREEGELYWPTDVTVDRCGNIVVLEQGNKRVRVFDASNGHSLKCFPVVGEMPFGIDVNFDGGFVVTSWGKNGGIRCYSEGGELLNTYVPAITPGQIQAGNLAGVAVLQDGRMVVVDLTRKSCLLLQSDGSFIREIGRGQLEYPSFVAVDEESDVVFVTDCSAHKVFAFDLAMDGASMCHYGGNGQNASEILTPNGVTLTNDGNIIVVNCDDGLLHKFHYVHGNVPYMELVERLVKIRAGKPLGITMTPDGYIAVACSNLHCVKMYRFW